jgi:diadenosine tetraphosphate (Ap4A) HIT family hydrolase
MPPIRAAGEHVPRVVLWTAAWCGVFAVVHVFWALGGSTGLASSAGADLAARRPAVFVIVGLWGVGLALLLAAVGIAVVGTARTGSRTARIGVRSIRIVGLGLLVRGAGLELLVAADIGGVRTAVGSLETRWSLILWNPWFVLGGALFVETARCLRHRASASRRRPTVTGERAATLRGCPGYCGICAAQRGEGPLAAPTVWSDGLVVVRHAAARGERVVLGHLVVETRRHAAHLDGLSDAEAAAAGRAAHRAAVALRAELDVEHVHAAVVNQRIEHFHQHVYVRHRGTPAEFAWWRADEWPGAPQGTPSEVAALCVRLATHFLRSANQPADEP